MNYRVRFLIGVVVAFALGFAVGPLLIALPRLTWGYLASTALIVGVNVVRGSKKSKIRIVVAAALGFAGGYWLFPKAVDLLAAPGSHLLSWQTGLLSAFFLGAAWAIAEGLNIVHSRLWAFLLGLALLLGVGIAGFVANFSKDNGLGEFWTWGLGWLYVGLLLGAIAGHLWDKHKKLEPEPEDTTGGGPTIVHLN